LGFGRVWELESWGRGGWRQRVGDAKHVIDISLFFTNILRKLYLKLSRIAPGLPTAAIIHSDCDASHLHSISVAGV
jgi:hypothetical protein